MRYYIFRYNYASVKKERTSSMLMFSNRSLMLSASICRSLAVASSPHSTSCHVCYYDMAFSNVVLFWVLLYVNRWVFSTQNFLRVLLFINSAFQFSSLCFHILRQNCFVSLSSCYWYVFVNPPYLLIEFSFVVLECPVLPDCFIYPVSVSF